MHLLFWLSLMPFVTAWVGNAHEHATPAAAYGVVALMSAVAYTILVVMILKANPGSAVVRAIGNDVKGKLFHRPVYARGGARLRRTVARLRDLRPRQRHLVHSGSSS